MYKFPHIYRAFWVIFQSHVVFERVAGWIWFVGATVFRFQPRWNRIPVARFFPQRSNTLFHAKYKLRIKERKVQSQTWTQADIQTHPHFTKKVKTMFSKDLEKLNLKLFFVPVFSSFDYSKKMTIYKRTNLKHYETMLYMTEKWKEISIITKQ